MKKLVIVENFRTADFATFSAEGLMKGASPHSYQANALTFDRSQVKSKDPPPPPNNEN